jgi:hypothetical protein
LECGSIVIGYLIMTAMSSTTLAARFGVLAAIGVVVAIVTCAMIKDPSPTIRKQPNTKKPHGRTYTQPKEVPLVHLGNAHKVFHVHDLLLSALYVDDADAAL